MQEVPMSEDLTREAKNAERRRILLMLLECESREELIAKLKAEEAESGR
ncbi:MAG: hypothetical protein LBO63_04430 [Oscillospiraceae bacterium]|jgi:hypothetical protein|nr:hypothetical protein [Oscillospiraceae bacterium]